MITARFEARVPIVALVVSMQMVLAPPVSAQGVATSFEQLRGLVKPGDTVYVTDANGRETKGKLGDLSTSLLELLVRKTGPDGRDVLTPQPRRSEGDVREIKLERPDSLKNGTLIGFAAGAPVGLVAIFTSSGTDADINPVLLVASAILVWGGIGAGVGALIDRSIRERTRVYQAPGQRSSGVRISPLLSKSAAGVEMSIRF